MRRTIGTPAWRDRDLPHLRPLIHESAALQGFRPDLVFHGGAGQVNLAIGNAVPPPLAHALVTAATGITTPMPMQLELDYARAAA